MVSDRHHPAAVPVYERAGFRVYDVRHEVPDSLQAPGRGGRGGQGVRAKAGAGGEGGRAARAAGGAASTGVDGCLSMADRARCQSSAAGEIYKIFIRAPLRFAFRSPADRASPWIVRICVPVSAHRHAAGAVRRHCERASFGGCMDAIYLLILAGLYAITHALIWALHRLERTS
jgi:hypothetical protein